MRQPPPPPPPTSALRTAASATAAATTSATSALTAHARGRRVHGEPAALGRARRALPRGDEGLRASVVLERHRVVDAVAGDVIRNRPADRARVAAQHEEIEAGHRCGRAIARDSPRPCAASMHVVTAGAIACTTGSIFSHRSRIAAGGLVHAHAPRWGGSGRASLTVADSCGGLRGSAPIRLRARQAARADRDATDNHRGRRSRLYAPDQCLREGIGQRNRL